MASNLEKYRKALSDLIEEGTRISMTLVKELYPEDWKKIVRVPVGAFGALGDAGQ